MGQEIQIQGWNGKNLWENFQKQHPEVTDQKCRRILFNITLVFNILPTLSNQNLKSVLQYILGYNCSYNKDSMATLETRVKILSAIVNSDETDEKLKLPEGENLI